jgi:hypothetical protein
MKKLIDEELQKFYKLGYKHGSTQGFSLGIIVSILSFTVIQIIINTFT